MVKGYFYASIYKLKHETDGIGFQNIDCDSGQAGSMLT